jgi:response regulator RpfG family c-di-GMP phosphodiesterase
MDSSPKVLFIDDDEALLSSMRRQFGQKFSVEIAEGGLKAIELVKASIESNSRFSVIVCDMRMPGLDGIQTLNEIEKIDKNPVAIMLTGNADQQTAIDAINNGNVYSFYTKPCSAKNLESAIYKAQNEYNIQHIERDLLERTLAGSVKILTDLVSFHDESISQHTSKIRYFLKLLIDEKVLKPRWQLEIASSLALIGYIAMPIGILNKWRDGDELSESEALLLSRAPEFARNLIVSIPRLNSVAETLYLQDRGFDGTGFPHDGPVGGDIPQDARAIKIIKDLATAVICTNGIVESAFSILDQKISQYDVSLYEKIKEKLNVHEILQETPTEDLSPVEKIAEEVHSFNKTHGTINANKHNAIHRLKPSTATGKNNKKSHKKAIAASGLAVLAMSLLAASALYYGNDSGVEYAPKLPKLVSEQILKASSGEQVADGNGIQYKVINVGGVNVVNVDGVPSKLCSDLSWILVKSGTVSINGITPKSVSRMTLINLCKQAENGSVQITFSKDQ